MFLRILVLHANTFASSANFNNYNSSGELKDAFSFSIEKLSHKDFCQGSFLCARLSSRAQD